MQSHVGNPERHLAVLTDTLISLSSMLWEEVQVALYSVRGKQNCFHLVSWGSLDMQHCDLPLGLTFTGHYLQVCWLLKIKLQCVFGACTSVRDWFCHWSTKEHFTPMLKSLLKGSGFERRGYVGGWNMTSVLLKIVSLHHGVNLNPDFREVGFS